MTAPTMQIDWGPELTAIAPYMAQKSGVIQFKFTSEDCAPNHFSTLLKQKFAANAGNGVRFSIRIDHTFATTLTPDDILDEFEAQLARIGIQVLAKPPPETSSILTGNYVEGNMMVSIDNFVTGNPNDRNSLTRRVGAVSDALTKFVADGGRFMIEFRDSPKHFQDLFWRDIWAHLLKEFTENGMVFVHMLGPECRQKSHEDAPVPQQIKTLPSGFETDQAREDGAYNDLIDIFRKEGLTDGAASAAAGTHLAQNLNSVNGLHFNLTGVLMSLRARRGEGA